MIDALNWRYTAKRMNGNKIPKEQLAFILEAIRLAPSSFGLQPYSIIVIENVELMKKIQPIANNQPQITEASVLLVFAVWENITQVKIDEHITRISTIRGVTEDSLKHKREEMEVQLKNNADENYNWASKQAYLAMGIGLTAAALEKVDTTPMESFNHEDLDEILQLKERGLRSVLLLALGYRDEKNDQTVYTKKVRREKESLFITLQSTIGFTASNINKDFNLTTLKN